MSYTLMCGDAVTMLKTLPAGSVDAVVTDPPYPKEYLGLWEPMAKECSRLLKPGGWMLVYSGQLFMPSVLSSLSAHLTYRWCIALLHAQSQIVWPAHSLAQWKPIFVLQNGLVNERGTPIRRDVLKPRGMDKRFHEWGQNYFESVELLDQFTEPGDIILDPFMGAGTTGVACIKSDRHFIGIEIDPVHHATAQGRIEEAQLQRPLLTHTRIEQAQPLLLEVL